MSELLHVDTRDHVRTLRLDRPRAKNAINEELAWAVIGAIEAASRDDDVWVIAITGTGDAFCAGLDLKAFGTGHDPQSPQTAQLDDIGWVGRFFYALREGCDKPIVAGINGVAVGAGLSLALAADIRIVARGARLMAGYPRIGGSPDGGLTFTLPQAIGYEQAMRFLLENRSVEGPEAVALGLAGEVVDDDALSARLQAYCRMLTERSPITLRLTKRGLAAATRSIDLPAQLRFEVANIRRAFASEDGLEARKAFLEKRPPVFKGR
jgi:2-(1,2-epoxy-1,2-dihydrophenyl)acetyl-CoA isomerase